MEWITNNVQWVFSGVGATVIAILLAKFFKLDSPSISAQPIVTQNSIIINNSNGGNGDQVEEHDTYQSNSGQTPKKTLDEFKGTTRILFIDDDSHFKVAKILIKSGWLHTKLVKDVKSLDDRDVLDASILFIDVQGVGLLLGFADEGLGLAEAIKEKYPNKKVVIYSAETQGDRFHRALRKADSFLPKNADPYEFQKIVEEFTIGEEG